MTGTSLMMAAGFMTTIAVLFMNSGSDKPLDRLAAAMLLGATVTFFGLALLKAIG